MGRSGSTADSRRERLWRFARSAFGRKGARQVAGLALVLVVVVSASVLLRDDLLSSVRATSDSPEFLLVLFGLYLVRPIFALPPSLLTVYVGFEFGYVGVVVALAGNLLSAIPAYSAGRYFMPGEGPLGWLTHSSERVVDSAGDFRSVLVASVSPVPLDVVAYSVGTAGVGGLRFAVGTVLGDLPWVILYISVGASMGHFTTRGIRTPIWALVGVTALILVIVARYLYRESHLEYGAG